MYLDQNFVKAGVDIYCETHEQSDIMLQELENAGLIWMNSAVKPTERDYWDDSNPGITYSISHYRRGELRITNRRGPRSGSDTSYMFGEVMVDDGDGEFEVSDERAFIGLLSGQE